jgi:hypothetical protein
MDETKKESEIRIEIPANLELSEEETKKIVAATKNEIVDSICAKQNEIMHHESNFLR